MAEATCRRELDLEIPATEVQKAIERVAREFARVARVPGFRPGKAPIPLIRRRFADDIKGEVLQSLLPEQIDKAVKDQKLIPITQPQVDHVDYAEDRPLKFRASFEVLPEFELGAYKGVQVEVEKAAVTDADVDKTIETMRERGATFVALEDRALESGDYAQLKLVGTPIGGGEPLMADNVLCHIGSEETLEAFTQNLVGAKPSETRRFEVDYPADYPDRKLAGKKYAYSAEVVAVKQKKLPELNDEFAKDVSDVKTLDELRAKVRQELEKEVDQRHSAAVSDAVLAKIVAAHDFPAPEALVENQMDVRLERAVRTLAAQGVDPRAVNVDWVAMRRRQHPRAIEDVKAELLLDRIATAENIEATDEETDREIARISERSGESVPAVRASLTKQGALDRMKSKLRSEKTLEWLQKNAEIKTREPERS
jgi:trigger factor